MIHVTEILPGITLRCFPDQRFKQGCLSVQLVRPMCREEAAMNALIPAVLLRGTVNSPDLRDIILRLDDLYGASVGALVRRVGDYQTTGLHCGFIEDRFALDGDRVLEPMIRFLGELMLQPALENGVFRDDYVQSEKRNLILTIESQLNDKRAYASAQLLRRMCSADSFGIPRLGEKAQVEAIEAGQLYDHYQKILRQSRIELFYVGAADPETVAALLKPLFEKIDRDYVNLSGQKPFCDGGESHTEETMEVAQGKLALGLTTPITLTDPRFAAMQVCNTVFGGGMTSKLFMQVREKQSLCYDIGSGYHGVKGIVLVNAGIDCDKKDLVLSQVQQQLQACVQGDISPEELEAAKQAIVSSLRSTHDSPGAIESYYATAALSGLPMTPAQYMQAVEAVTAEQVAQAAATVHLHTVYFLKGVD
jgi:predicted Zn-dependent peptidase